VVFVGAFESDVGFTLKERKSTTLDQLQIDSLKVEANLALMLDIESPQGMFWGMKI